MQLVINRLKEWSTKNITIGGLFIDNLFECYTLEDAIREYPNKVAKQTAIWKGSYIVTIDMSARFKRLMPHILDVPLFDGIRFHAGNTIEDTEGCPLLGKRRMATSISESVKAFDQFYRKLKEAFDSNELIQLDILED